MGIALCSYSLEFSFFFCILSPLWLSLLSAPPYLSPPLPPPQLRAQGNVTQISTRLRPSRRTPTSSLPLSSPGVPNSSLRPLCLECSRDLFYELFSMGVRCWFGLSLLLFGLVALTLRQCRRSRRASTLAVNASVS